MKNNNETENTENKGEGMSGEKVWHGGEGIYWNIAEDIMQKRGALEAKINALLIDFKKANNVGLYLITDKTKTTLTIGMNIQV